MILNQFTNYSAPGYSGWAKYGLNNIQVAKKVILLPVGTMITNLAAAKLQATWDTLRKNPMATRAHPYPLAFEVKPSGGTTIMQKTPLSGSIPVREDVVELDLTYNVNQILATLLRQNNFKKWDVVLIDDNNNIMGTTPDGIVFKGLSTTSVHFSQMMPSDGAKSAESILKISFADPLEWNNAPALILGQGLTWFPKSLDGTEAVKIVASNGSVDGFTAGVYAIGLDASDPNAAFPGLAKADFILSKAGVVQSLSGFTMTDNGDGTYTFAGTLTSGTYTVTLVGPPSTISVVAYNIEVPTVGIGTFTF